MSRSLNFQHVALDASASSLTGKPWYSGDFATLTISIQSQTGTASRFTVVGSNADGLRSALPTPLQTVPSNGWSILTVITSEGLYAFDPYPGFRWVNVFRPSASSATITFNGRS